MARRAGVEPDVWQVDALRSQSKQIILNCARQSGKSTITALLALHEALYRAGSLTLVLAPSQRQSQELFRKVKDALNALPSLPVSVGEESALRIELANHSRIVCLPGKETTVRGFSGVSLLIVDEAARANDGLYFAIRPMLAVSGGRIILLSTPFGKRGFFFNEWENGGDQWHRLKITARECPRISAEWLEQERRRIGDWWFSQEYLCEFRDVIDAAFASADVDRALSDEVQPLFL